MRVIIRKAKWKSPLRTGLWIGCGVALLALVAGASILTFYYVRYSRMIDQRLQGDVFPNVAQVYAAPEKLRLGQPGSVGGVLAHLRQAGFGDRKDTLRGRYEAIRGGVRIYPGPDSYFSQEPAEVRFADGKVSSIVSMKDQFARGEYSLEPLLITNLFGRTREKRRLMSFHDLPPQLVQAVVAIEDRRFFEHSGIDFARLAAAVWVDLRSGSFRQGASTITQQVARSLFLNREGTLNREVSLRRKGAEAMVAFQLEHRLSKEEIFEYYANTIYLGQRGSFSVQGFGEAAQAYFRKDVRGLTLAEAAFLAGLPRGPYLYSPYRDPERAKRRRDQVLDAMLETHAIDQKQHDEAVAEPLEVAPSYLVGTEAPYFVDMIRDQLLELFSEQELTTQSYRIYTTLDLRLQRAAAEAVSIGGAELDKRLDGLRRPRSKAAAAATAPVVRPEIALVAIDAHTGDIKALVGGRDYGASQLNRALAMRQPGSVFKPFVYAAALTAYQNGATAEPWTAMSKVVDEPFTFEFNGKPYKPANFGQDYFGEVTLRQALMRSLNIVAVKLAENIGYETVVSMARRAGLNSRIQPTPALALGAYEVTPLEIAGAYTIFANGGVRVDPHAVALVRSRDGALLDITFPRKTPVLDPATAYLMTNLMADVINHGTGAAVRGRGFNAPAAGKTGSSHDGWFAGYTSDLICIVWVGYDSDRELPLTGGASALPVWTEFMQRAIQVPEYSRTVVPTMPRGIVTVDIDPLTGELATPHCPTVQSEIFLDGTQPGQYCHLHYLQQAQRPFSVPPPIVADLPRNEEQGSSPASPTQTITVPVPPPTVAKTPLEEEKKGFWRRVFGVFTNESKPDEGNSR